MKKIAVIGPESTGKSTLSKWLIDNLDATIVPEVSREYLKDVKDNYTVEDIYNIAKLQKKTESNIASESTAEFLISDTDLICILVWLDFYNYPIKKWLIEAIQHDSYDIYLLMDIDIQWQEDEFRNNPDDRKYLFDRFIYFLEKYNKNYKIISGNGTERNENALKEIIML